MDYLLAPHFARTRSLMGFGYSYACQRLSAVAQSTDSTDYTVKLAVQKGDALSFDNKGFADGRRLLSQANSH